MTGLRKRVTVGFLSIVCLLFFSGMVSFLELSHLSRDTGEILKANKRNIELAKEMLDAAHEQNIALIRLSVFGDRSCDSLCRKSMERLENTLLVAQSEALEKSFLDSLAFATTELRLLTDNFLAFGGAGSAAARTAIQSPELLYACPLLRRRLQLGKIHLRRPLSAQPQRRRAATRPPRACR